jgi:hypothetical protein
MTTTLPPRVCGCVDGGRGGVACCREKLFLDKEIPGEKVRYDIDDYFGYLAYLARPMKRASTHHVSMNEDELSPTNLDDDSCIRWKPIH